MQEITNYTMNEANSSGDFNALIHPQSNDRQDMLKSLNVIVNENKKSEIETVIRAKDGLEKNFLFQLP